MDLGHKQWTERLGFCVQLEHRLKILNLMMKQNFHHTNTMWSPNDGSVHQVQSRKEFRP